MRAASLFAILLATLLSAVRTANAATEIPIAYRDGMIWLKVRLTGQSAPLNFLLDSGAGRSVIHLGTARRVGARLGAPETVLGVQGCCTAYRVKSLAATFATVPIPSEMLALDLTSVSAGCGARIDGLLGADFFRGRIVQIDFAAQKLRLLDRGELPGSATQILPIARRNDALCIRVGVNGNAPEWMRFDTGCSGALEWVVTTAKASRVPGASFAATAGSDRSVHTDIILGGERIAAVKTGIHQKPIFRGEAGLLGNGLLSKFCVTVDADRSQLLLSRTN